MVPFRTDLASVPRFLSWLFPRYGKYTKAAVIHDYLCQALDVLAPGSTSRPPLDPAAEPLTLRDRSDADSAFLQMMTELEVPWARRLLMYSAVSWATVLTVLTAKKATTRVWLGRLMAALLVVAILVAAAHRRLRPLRERRRELGVAADRRRRRRRRGDRVGVADARGRGGPRVAPIGSCPTSVRQRSRSSRCPLILGGLAIGVLLASYLVVEDAPTGFKAIRKRWKLGKSPDAPRDERKEAVAEHGRPPPLPRRLDQLRSGSSCRAQPLPSGSRKKANEPQAKSWTSLTSTPRSTSSARAALTSATTI